MKTQIASLTIVVLMSCGSDVAPRVDDFLVPTEYASPLTISLPFQGNGIKLEHIVDAERQLFGNLHYIDNQKVFSGYESQLFKSIDGGKSWLSKFTSPVENSLITQILFSENNPDVGFAAGGRVGRFGTSAPTDGWIARTTNNGEQWTTVYRNPEHGIQSIFALTSKPGIIIAIEGTGYQGKAIIRSDDNGITWNTVYEGEKAGSIIPLTDEYLYTYSGLLSTDYGLTWSLASTENMRNLQGIHIIKKQNGGVLGVGYDIIRPPSYLGVQVFQTSFNPEMLTVLDSKLIFESVSDKFKLDWLRIRQSNKAPLMGEYYDYENDGLLLVYPNETKWQPLFLNGESLTPPLVGALWSVNRVNCFDWGCYFLLACCHNDTFGYHARLVKLTYMK